MKLPPTAEEVADYFTFRAQLYNDAFSIIIQLAEMYYKEEKLGVDDIAKTVGISKMTLYKYLRLRGVKISAYQGKQKSS